MFEFTGKCRICLSDKYGQAVTQCIVDGLPYDEIIQRFPELKLNAPTLSTHKKHFVAPETIDRASAENVSDHQALDRLRTLMVVLVEKELGGQPLSIAQTRILHSAVQGILGRKNIEDSQEQMRAFSELVEEAAKRKWKYEEEENGGEESEALDIWNRKM